MLTPDNSDETSLSSFVDLTTNDSDDDNLPTTDVENQALARASLKRRMSYLAMEDTVDHAKLQASIELDILQPPRSQATWGFNNLSRAFTVSKPSTASFTSSKASTPLAYEKSRSSSPLDSSPSVSISKHVPEVEVRQRTVGDHNSSECASTNTSPDPAGTNTEDSPTSQIFASQLTIKHKRRYLAAQMAEAPQSEIIIIDSDDSLENIETSSYTLDELETQKYTELLPDSTQDIIDLEEHEAAEQAIETQDETLDGFMNAAAVDENDAQLMNIIELEDDEATFGAEEISMSGIIDLSSDDEVIEPAVRPQRQPSTPSINAEFKNLNLSGAQYGAHTYKPGDGVEFQNGTFMRIKSLQRGTRGNVILSGPLLTRHYQHALDPKNWSDTRLFPNEARGNELVWTVTVDGSPTKDAEYVERELSDVKRPRDIILTNQTWPCKSTRSYKGLRGTHMLDHGPLYCRWKRVKQIQIKELGQEYEDCIVRLTSAKADTEHSVKPSKLRFASRRTHVPQGGGSFTTRQDFVVDGITKTRAVTMYTFADGFCGAGGASSGADQAELSIKWAFDIDGKAVISYRRNFSKKGVVCFQEDISDFIDRVKANPGPYMVDVLHLSPPCQAFSLARTRGSQEIGEGIQAVLLSVRLVLEHLKPRILTIEQTSGLLYAHKVWLAAVINDIIESGYSIRWKLMQSEQYGVPQIRKRVVIIAAGPGESLPPWPTPTHGPSLKSLVTINNVIRHIPSGASHHQIISQFKSGPKASYVGNIQARTVTCCGGDDARNYHPSGERPFTVREFACLQTFPTLHSFGNANLTTAKRQIGNAFPPSLAKAVFKAVVKSLREADAKE